MLAYRYRRPSWLRIRGRTNEGPPLVQLHNGRSQWRTGFRMSGRVLRNGMPRRTMSGGGRMSIRIDLCRTCGEPVYAGRGMKYCPKHRDKLVKRRTVAPQDIATKDFGRPLTRVEQYLIRTGRDDLVYQGDGSP